MKTADSGYLTRRLVDVAQDVIIREEDCGTDRGIRVSALREGTEEIENLYDRLVGRTAFETVAHPETGEVFVEKNQLITEELAREIVDAGVEQVEIRTAFTCNTSHGVCKKCYVVTWQRARTLKLGKPSVSLPRNQSVSQGRSLQCVRSTQVG